MDIELLKEFLGLCLVINIVFLLITGLGLMFAGDFIFKVHSRWWPMPRETFNVVIYSFLGVYKLLFFVFCLVPWLALCIMECCSTPM